MAPKKGTTPPPQDENETPPEEPPVHEEQQEPTMQQILEIMAQQQKQTNALVTMLVGAKGAGKGGGNPTGDGAEPPAFQRSTMVKPETAPVFNGRGYELWKKNLDDWESLHYAVDEYQKPGLLMRALQGEVLSLVRAELRSQGLKVSDGQAAYEAMLNTLEQHYGVNASLKQFRQFQRLISAENFGDNLEAYMRNFTIRAEEAREEGLDLPESLNVFMMLHGSKLAGLQLQSVFTGAEQAARARGESGLHMKDVKEILKTMAQARDLRAGSGRRGRHPAFVGLETGEDADPELDTDEWGDSTGDFDEEAYEIDEDALNEDESYVAAVAQLQRKFLQRRKGQGKGDNRRFLRPKGGANQLKTGANRGGGGKSGANQEKPGANRRKNRDCKYTGEDADGSMKCHSLRDNKVCDYRHTEAELAKARDKLKAKGAVPTFNAFDATESFEDLTKHLGSRCVPDSGAKKNVCGEAWLKRYQADLRKREPNGPKVTNIKVDGEPRRFQFGGGTKVSTGRKRVPFVLDTGDEMEWSDMTLDVVPGWLPLLFAYDGMKHNRMVIDTDADELYVKTENGLKVVHNCKPDERTGILALDLLPDPKTYTRKIETSDCGNALAGIAVERPGTVRETRPEGRAAMARGSWASPNPLSDKTNIAAICTNRPANLWDLYKATEDNADTSKLAPVSMTTELEIEEDHDTEEVGVTEKSGAVSCVDNGTTSAKEQEPRAPVGLLADAAPEVHESTGTAPPAFLDGTGNAHEGAPEVPAFLGGTGNVHEGAPDVPALLEVAQVEDDANAASIDVRVVGKIRGDFGKIARPHEYKERDKKTEARKSDTSHVPVNGKVRHEQKEKGPPDKAEPPDEADDQENNKEKKGRAEVRPITKQRLKHLHVLTHHTMSTHQLKNLLKRARVPNLQQALGWYRDVIAQCNCNTAEYMHRHRVPRLLFKDTPFNEEVELDVMKLAGKFWLVAVCRGTLYPIAVRMANREATSVRDAFMCRWLLVFGAPARGISDSGGEFLSRAFLEAMDLHLLLKEATPAYASDRHAAVERLIRTVREAAERALRGAQQRLTLADLDVIVAVIINEAANDLQPCGTSAAQRAFGRTTSPFLSLLQHPVMPAPSALANLQAEARNRWREVANDRKFQQLLTLQLGPQANTQPPVHGSLVYYRRPNPMNDGPVYRGPAVVIGTDNATEQSYLSHGGLLVRAANEHLRLAPGQPPREDPGGIPDGRGAGQVAVRYEELDDRDGPPAEPPADVPPAVVVVPPLPEGRGEAPGKSETLEPRTPQYGYGTPAKTSGGDKTEKRTDGDFSPPVEVDVDTTSPDPTAVHPTADWSGGKDRPDESPVPLEPLTPGEALRGWYDDDKSEGPELLPQADADVFDLEEQDVPIDADAGLTDDPGLDLAEPQVEEDEPHYGLKLGEMIAVRVNNKWQEGRVFGLDDREDRVSVEWQNRPANDERYESLNLGDETWRRVQNRELRMLNQPAYGASKYWDTSTRPRRPPPAFEFAAIPADSNGDERSEPAGRLAETAPMEGELIRHGELLAALAELRTTIATVAGTSEREPEDSPARTPAVPALVASGGDGTRRILPQPRSLLTALLAHAPRRLQALPGDDSMNFPSSLTPGAAQRAGVAVDVTIWTADALEMLGMEIAAAIPGCVDHCVYAYLEREMLTRMSDANALATLEALGERYAPPAGSTWEVELSSAISQLLKQHKEEDVSELCVGKLLVILNHGLAVLQGREVASVPAMVAQVESGGKAQAGAPEPRQLETEVYKYGMDDVTDEQRHDGAVKELGNFDKYETWGSDYCTAEEVPDDADVIDTKLVEKTKIVDGKLMVRSRLCARGFNDPQAHEHRNDSPAVGRTTFFCFLTTILSLAFQLCKIDISGAFLQGKELVGRCIYLMMPNVLIDMGLVDKLRRFRKIIKGVYGLNVAPRLWFLRLASILKGMNFAQSHIDPCLFILTVMGKVVCIIAVYVDDLLIGGKKEMIIEIVGKLSEALTVGTREYSWEVSEMSYTGKDLELTKDADGTLTKIKVHQTAYIQHKLAPTVENDWDSGKRSAQAALTPKECGDYRELQGQTAWTSNTRMDVAYDISENAGASHAPTVGDMKRLHKLARHIVSTADKGIELTPIKDPCTVLFADGSWANAEDNKTKGGHAVFLASKKDVEQGNLAIVCLLAWICASLKRVCTSTFDAEALSLLRGSDELLAVAYLMSEMYYGRMPSIAEKVLMYGFGTQEIPRPMLEMYAFNDGQGVIDSLNTTKWAIKSKRRRVDISAMRETAEMVKYGHCPTWLNVVDGLTKRDWKLRKMLELAMAGRVQFF